MNPNKFDRQAFVRAVMDDVPMIDYEELARSKATQAVLSLLPREVLGTYKKYPNYFTKLGVSLPSPLGTLYMPTPGYSAIKDQAPKVWEELTDMAAKLVEQSRKRRELELKITGIIESCRTLKQAKDRLPEFEKYLPADRSQLATQNLPVANLVADLTAAGWPKGQK